MTVEKCYEIMKGDYKDVLSRLMTDDRIKKFLLKMLNDPSFSELTAALENGDMEEAFRAAHTLKGVSKNLAITPLASSAGNLTEALRGKKEYNADIEALFKKVKKDYSLAITAIQMF